MKVRLVGVLVALVLLTAVAASAAPRSTGQVSDECATALLEAEQLEAFLARSTPAGTSQTKTANDLRAFIVDVRAACPTTTTTSSTTTTTAPTTSTTEPPDSLQFPNPDNTGVPADWVPTTIRTTNLRVDTPGAVIQNVEFRDANLEIAAPNVTVKNVRLRGGVICNSPAEAGCDGMADAAGDGMVIEDSTIEPSPGETHESDLSYRIGPGGYTLRGVEVLNAAEGLRVGGNQDAGLGPVIVEDSYISILPPEPCGDWHGDGIQGYDGDAFTLRHSTIDMDTSSGCGGTAPFFFPLNGGNTSVNVDGLLVAGPNGNISFRDGVPGRVVGLHIEDGSWFYWPVDVRCTVITGWGADIVGPVDRTPGGYQVPGVVRDQPCSGDGT